MRKFKLYTIAIIDGLIIIAAATAAILGFIHSISTSAEYALLMLSPVPIAWVHMRLSKVCDKLNEIEK